MMNLTPKLILILIFLIIFVILFYKNTNDTHNENNVNNENINTNNTQPTNNNISVQDLPMNESYLINLHNDISKKEDLWHKQHSSKLYYYRDMVPIMYKE